MTNPMNETWDAAISGVQNLSDMLNGLVATLVKEGWSDEQARSLVVAMFVSQARGPQ